MANKNHKKLTKEEFIRRAKEVHCDKYDYSKTVYKNKRTKVTITCAIHGDFEQSAQNHMNGQGCPICGKKYAAEWQKGKWEHFTKKSVDRFGNIYEFPYIKEEYVNSHSKITIKCKKCGSVFTKITCDHLTSAHGGCSCMKTQPTKKIKINNAKKSNKIIKKNGKKALTLEEVKRRAEEKTNGKVSCISDAYYKNSIPILFKCNVCGYEYKRAVSNFFSKSGHQCPKCNNRIIKVQDKDSMIKESEKIYGKDRYDYSRFKYVKSDIKGIVVCHRKDKFGNEHGEFEVTPHAHVGSMHSGCPKCSRKYSYTLEEWKKEAKYVHGEDYDYSLIDEYKGARVKMPIICHQLDYNGKEHGVFYQDSNQHLTGQGCPKCSKSHLEKKIECLLESEGYKFIPQANRATLPWLDRLSLDVYIPDIKTAIEIQGDEHFRPIKYWGGEETFRQITERDDRKNKLCIDNGVKILYYCEKEHKDYKYPLIKSFDELLEFLVTLKRNT